MTVPTLESVAEFSTNGVTTNFPFFFKFLANEDLVVTYIDPLGTVSVLALGTHYTVNGAGDEDGGSVVTTTALAGPGQLVVSREMDAYQQTSLRNQGKFLAETHEDVFDRLTMLIQQGFSIFTRALVRPFGKAYYDAQGRNISNLKDPVDVQDATTKNWVSAYFADLIDQVTGLINTTTGIIYDAGTLFDHLRFGVNRTVDSIAALKLLQGSRNQRAFVLGYYAAGDGGGGAYRIDPTDTTSVDNGGTIIVAADGSRWKLVQTTDLTVKQFGAKGDGVTNDTAAFNRCVAYANARGGIDFLNIVGTTFVIPDGRYVLGAVNPISRSGCEFVGSSRDGAVLLLTSNTSAFTFGDGVNIVVGGGVYNVKIEYLSTPSASSFVFTFDLAYRIKIGNLLVANIGVLAKLGVSSSRPCGTIAFDGIDGSKANVACPLFSLNYGAGLFLDGVNVFIPVGVPTHPASMATVLGCHVLGCFTSNGFWDTVQASRCLFERFDMGLSVVAVSGAVYQNMFFSNVIMDYFKRYAVYSESQAGGVIAGIRFDNTSWFVSWETNCIELLGAGYNDNHEFMGKIVIAGSAGVKYSLINAKNVTFNGMQINSVNRLGTASGAFVMDAGTNGFTVIGCKGNVDTTGIGFPWRAPYGMTIGANADSYVVTGNKFEGSTAPYQIAANSSGSTNRLVHDNAGANYAASLGLALPASGVALVNTTPFKVDFLINGGTVTGISRNGTGIVNMTSGALTADPGQSVTITYSVAPSVTSFARS